MCNRGVIRTGDEELAMTITAIANIYTYLSTPLTRSPQVKRRAHCRNGSGPLLIAGISANVKRLADRVMLGIASCLEYFELHPTILFLTVHILNNLVSGYPLL